MQISEDWVAAKSYLHMNVEIEYENESANSNEKQIYRRNVAWSLQIRQYFFCKFYSALKQSPRSPRPYSSTFYPFSILRSAPLEPSPAFNYAWDIISENALTKFNKL